MQRNSKRNAAVPATNTRTSRNSLPSNPQITNGGDGGGCGAGAGQLASQSTQEQAGSFSYKKK